MNGRLMAIIIEMPKLSDTMTEGTLVRWLKKEGDKVRTGDVLAEVETDKATMEMAADDEGILGKIYVPAGSKAGLGVALAVLVEEGEAVPDAPTAKVPAAPAAAAGGGAPAAAAPRGPGAKASGGSAAGGAGGRV